MADQRMPGAALQREDHRLAQYRPTAQERAHHVERLLRNLNRRTPAMPAEGKGLSRGSADTPGHLGVGQIEPNAHVFGETNVSSQSASVGS